jgi:hypothetical protein
VIGTGEKGCTVRGSDEIWAGKGAWTATHAG